MKLCIKYRVNPTKQQELYLDKLGYYATKLYNTDNYQRRENWNLTGKIPNWYEQKKSLKKNHWFKLLPSQTAQSVIKNLQENYNSWFKLRKIDETANPPMFRKKDKLSVITFFQQFKLKDNQLTITMSKKFKEENKTENLTLDIEKWKEIKGIPKMCNILKQNNKWMAHIVYEIPEPNLTTNKNMMGVDLGIINLISTCDLKGKSKIYSGKQALSIQHYFNKEIAKVQSKLKKQQKREKCKSITKMHKKKSKQINQILHTATSELIKNAKESKIGTIVIGDIKNIRKDKHWRKKTTQKLHSWGFAKLTSQIIYKAKLSGIRVLKVSERYTSQTCSNCGLIRKSNRKHRGLYKCKNCGTKINADTNGAKNILKKYLQENKILRSIGCVEQPLIWRCQNVIPS